MMIRKAFLMMGSFSVFTLNSFAGSFPSKNYNVEKFGVYIAVQCDQNGAVSSVFFENPGIPGITLPNMKGKRELQFVVPELPGSFVYTRKDSDLDFKLDTNGDIFFIQKGRVFSSDRKIRVGKVDVARACLESDRRDIAIGGTRIITRSPGLDVSASITMKSGCHSSSRWPDQGVRYMREVVETVTLKDKSTGVTLSLEDKDAESYASEADCQVGALP